MAEIHVEVTQDTWNEVARLAANKDNWDITEEEYSEQLMRLLGLKAPPHDGDDLRIHLKARPAYLSVPR